MHWKVLFSTAVATAVLLGNCSGAAVQTLTDDGFDELVLSNEAASWVVEFGASDSPARGKELNELAKILQGTGIKVGYVDTTGGHKCAAGKMGLKFYGPDKSKKTPKTLATSSGKLDVVSVVEKVFKEIQQVVSSRLTSTSGGKTSGKKSHTKTKGKPFKLDEGNFEEHVMKSDEAFMVAFIAPWCGHCKALAPEFEQAATQLEGSGVVIAEVDATANERLAQRFGVQGYPTIKFFPPGVLNKNDRDVIDYQMERSADAISSWALQQFEKHGGKVTIEIPEIASQDSFDELCKEDGKCILVFLPNLLDSGKAGREEFIDQIKEAQRSARHIKFGWLAAGSQPLWEETYNLGFGFPAVVYLRKHQSKNLGLIMRSNSLSSLGIFASSAKSLNEFEENGWPSLNDVTPWDGEDAAPLPEADEDDFDLDEFLSDS